MFPHLHPICVYIQFFYVSIYTHYILTSHLNLSASQPIISFSMRFDIVSSLQAWQDEASSWASDPVVNHAGTYVSLSAAVGKNAKSPCGVPNPPLFHPTNSKYQFDPGQFTGLDGYHALCEMLKMHVLDVPFTSNERTQKDTDINFDTIVIQRNTKIATPFLRNVSLRTTFPPSPTNAVQVILKPQFLV